ncbi:hypothetical protein Hypma_000958 [Hypsizygus marmoreus]|uniref:PH domain-containing protein n=1 Tax=Hypsizygus marmoreus TaxID=39966 RepID=A0A369J6U7_HYPMA|nr:hypothetical protein Hypma_000958 [Hypsizygus marmoreus]
MAQIQPWSLRELSGSTTLLLNAPIFSTSKKGVLEDLLPPPHILVRNPPRDQLPAEPPQFCEDSPSFVSFVRHMLPHASRDNSCPHHRGNSHVSQVSEVFGLIRVSQQATFPGQSNTLDPELYITPLDQDSGPSEQLRIISKSTRRTKVRMAKKRRSLQALFIPSFLTAPPSPTDVTAANYNVTRMRSQSAADQTAYPYASHGGRSASESSVGDSPPDFLLDDDPFANLSAPSASSRPSPAPPLLPVTPLPPKPRSPLTPNTPEIKPSFLASPSRAVTPLSPPGVSRALSGRARPAYQKPAFATRPSLPSLDTLARMNVVVTKKVRKGRVGAGLPFEPWDNLDSPSTPSTSQESIAILPPPESSGLADTRPADFVADLELDFLDFLDDEHLDLSRAGDPPSFGHLHPASPTQPDLSYSADSEASFDEELSSPPFSRTASELSMLTRSTSLSSTSSIESSHGHQWPSFSSYNVSSSSAEDSDAFNSPPDDYFTFPSSRYSSNIMSDPYWSSEFMYDTFDFDHTSHNALFSDVNYLGESPTAYEPGTSAGTIRPSMEPKTKPTDVKVASASFASTRDSQVDGGEAVDGAGRDEHQSQHGGFSRSWEQGKGGGSGRVNGGSRAGNGYASGNGRAGINGRGDDEDEDKKRTHRSTFSTPSDSDSSDSESEDSMDDHGVPARARASGSAPPSDDDVPLAQRIPTALRAQRTIRRQVREEREQRRAARAMRNAESASAPSRQHLSRPPGAGDPLQSAPMSSSQEAALHASRSSRRPRTKTLPASEMQPFNPEDLTRKLQTMEVAQPPISQHHRSNSGNASKRERSGSSRPGSAGRDTSDPKGFQPFASMPHSPQEGSRTLRLMRSFHRSEKKVDDHRSVPMPFDSERKIGRSLTRTRTRADTSTSNAISPRSYAAQISHDESLLKLPPRRSAEEGRKHVKVNHDTKPPSASIELERSPRPSLQQRPPVPPLPADVVSGSSHTSRGTAAQQRIFVGDMQRFNMVEIGPSTNAGNVIEMVEAQGTLKGWVGSGGWMVWEVAQDFGMERPIRSFELLADVQASWNKDKMMNTFIIKLTPLAVPLSRSAMPTASPMHSGYIEWETKRGKWNKRWLQLREHSLWLSKRDNGRDEVLLCSLSNFDAYFITRPYKAPRPFSFAIKSTDNLSFFENTADYLHIFSCGEKEGAAWMEAILLARSYVLFQERNVLFNPKATGGNAASNSTSLSRAGTRKSSSARPAQTLLAVPPPFTGNTQHMAHSNDVFEPGSLLRKLA